MKKFILLLAIFSLISCKSIKNSTFIFKENSEMNFYRVTEESGNLLSQDSIDIPWFLEQLYYSKTFENLPTEKDIKLIEEYYKKIDVDVKSKMKIVAIFNEAGFPINEDSFGMGRSCPPLYRDILIYKEKGKVIAFSKICLACYRNYMILKKHEHISVEINYVEIKEILDILASN